MWRRRAVALATCVGLSIGCSLATTDDLSGNDPNHALSSEGGVDATTAADAPATEDARTGEDAGTASDAQVEETGAPNLLTNGDFELGCAGWFVEYGFISESTVARDGAKSCRFCMDTNVEAKLTRAENVVVTTGEQYVGEVWVRPDPSSAVLADAGYAGSSLWISAGGAYGTPTAGPPLANDWSRASTLFEIPEDAGTLRLTFSLQGNPAGGNVICVDLDSAAVRRIK